jgi:hypothetical protein
LNEDSEQPNDPRLTIWSVAINGGVIQDDKDNVGVFASASPRCLDGGDIDPLHRHPRLEGTLCPRATRRKRIV